MPISARQNFTGAADFGSAQIGSNFEAQEAKFLNEKAGANFNSMKVEDSALFEKAEFHGAVNFGLAQTGSNFEAQEAKFLMKQQE